MQQGGSSYPPIDSSLNQETAEAILSRDDLGLNSAESAPLAFIRTERGMMPFIPAKVMVIGIPAGKETVLLGALEAVEGLNRFDAGEPGEVAISGGERQWVAIARALANHPSLLLADEPTGNLDTKIGGEILEFFRKVCDEDGQTVIMVTHDFRAASYADRVLVLRDGRVRGETRLAGKVDMNKTLSQLLELEF